MHGKINFTETNFLRLLNTFRDYSNEIVQLLDKNSKIYQFCFEPYPYIILLNNTPIGFINIDISRCEKYNNFVDIWIRPEYRGKGLGYLSMYDFERKILPKLFEKYKVKKKCLAATIEKQNISSIKLFLKLGFKLITGSRRNKLINYGTLKNDEQRLIKCYD